MTEEANLSEQVENVDPTDDVTIPGSMFRDMHAAYVRAGEVEHEWKHRAQAAEAQVEAMRRALAPFAEAWRQAVQSAPNAPLGAINNLTTYFIGAGHYQDADRCLASLSAPREDENFQRIMAGLNEAAAMAEESSPDPDYEADFDWKAAWYALDHDAAKSRAQVVALRKVVQNALGRVATWAQGSVFTKPKTGQIILHQQSVERLRDELAAALTAPAEEAPAPMKTMCLTLTDEEMAALEELSKRKDLPGDRIFRQALKLYQLEAHGHVRVERAEARSAWAPIETAPKDGSRFLAYQADREAPRYECWWQEDFGHWEGWCDVWDSEPEPTHWQPLPTPPKAEADHD